MISREYAVTMARYNRWMNGKIYAACAGIADAERKADRGAFFGSIHRTLNHLLVADLIWLSRFTGGSREGLHIGQPLHEDFEALRAHREQTDTALLTFADGLTPEWLHADVEISSTAHGVFSRPGWVFVSHVFNHQTHHRGQVTTLLSQLGIDIGATDLPVLPDLAG